MLKTECTYMKTRNTFLPRVKTFLNVLLKLGLALSVFSACAQKRELPETTTFKLMRSSGGPSESSGVGTADSSNGPESPASGYKALETKKNLKTIAFVADTNVPGNSKLWKKLREVNPDLIVSVGNAISYNKFVVNSSSNPYGVLQRNNDISYLREHIPFMAMWSDMDYGLKNGSGTHSLVNKAKKDFLEYWNYIPSIRPESVGIEHSAIFSDNNKKIQIILLDTKTYSDEWQVSEDSKELQKNWNREQNFLGKQQWNWLKSELKKEASLRIIITHSVVGINSGNISRWGLFPHERQKLFDVIRDAGVKNYFVVSGAQSSLSEVKLINHPALLNLSITAREGTHKALESDSHLTSKIFSTPTYGIAEIEDEGVKIKIMNFEGKLLAETFKEFK